jgi:hypothetical protein
MKKTATLLAALLMTSTAAYAEAETGTGNEFLAHCQSDVGQLYCLGYVDGAVGTLVVAAAAYKSPRLVCVPEGVTVGQSAKVVERYLEAHPENLHLGARVLVFAALMATWPCK